MPEITTTEGRQPSDALELELRQLPGVSFVAFGRRGASVVIEVVVGPGVDLRRTTDEARRVAAGHLVGDVRVEVAVPASSSAPTRVDSVDPSSPAGYRWRRHDRRVALALALASSDSPEVEIHLAHSGRRVVVVTPSGDSVAAAGAAIEGISRLGLHVPFEVVTAEAVTAGIGEGTLVVLRHAANGELRRGLAGGRGREESSARAVLNALNRYLQPRVAPDPVR